MDIHGRGWQRRDFILSGGLLFGSAQGAVPKDGQRPDAKVAGEKTVLVLGDSLSAEYGLARGSGWVNLLSQRLQREKLPYRVLNASISGDTTSGGRSRLGALLAQHRPAVVIIELGGNDALRGLPLSMSEANLAAMVSEATRAQAKVLLVGVQVPPNYGTDYAQRFAGMFDKVAKERKAPLVPSILKGLADDADPAKWFQADRIHPLGSAQPIMLDTIWPSLQKLLR
jgi:acyl-CoA thioesterase-1